MRFESALTARFDLANEGLWQTVPDLTDPITTPAPTSAGSASVWRQRFFDLKRKPPSPPLVAEPPQPTRKRKPLLPYISRVIDFARSDASVAHIEQGVLAISELDAHLARLQTLSEGLPVSLSAAPFSPRGGSYFELWNTLPQDQRTLGHHLLILELSRLHLSRQTERLAQIHAWIAEQSTLTGSWPHLPLCDKTWELYTGPDGTFLRYLRKQLSLQQDIETAPNPAKDRAFSESLRQILVYQAELAALTIDYARFIDRQQEPPVPLETLLGAWQALHKTLLRVETLTVPPVPDLPPGTAP